MPTGGKVWFEGQTTAQMDRDLYRRDHAAVIYQSYNLFPLLTAQENVLYPLKLRGVDGKTALELAQKELKAVGIQPDQFKRFPSQLSGGEQQRVAIARALLQDPCLILADEPTGSVDTKTGNYILDVFRELNRSMGLTIVIVTHDRQLSKKVNRVVSIRDGKTSSEMIMKQSYADVLASVGALGDVSMEADTHTEYAVLDRAGRVQIPKELLESIGVTGNQLRLEVENGKIIITPPSDRK